MDWAVIEAYQPYIWGFGTAQIHIKIFFYVVLKYIFLMLQEESKQVLMMFALFIQLKFLALLHGLHQLVLFQLQLHVLGCLFTLQLFHQLLPICIACLQEESKGCLVASGIGATD